MLNQYDKPIDEPLSHVELQVVHVVLGEGYGYAPGSFFEALIHAMFLADPINLARLGILFDEYATAVQSYTLGNLHQRAMRKEKMEEHDSQPENLV